MVTVPAFQTVCSQQLVDVTTLVACVRPSPLPPACKSVELVTSRIVVGLLFRPLYSVALLLVVHLLLLVYFF